MATSAIAMDREAPAGRLRALRSRDIDEQASFFQGWNQTYNQISQGTFEGGYLEGGAPSLQLFREFTSSSLHQTGTVPEGCFAVGIPINLHGRATFCGAACDGNQLHVFSGEDGFEFYSPSGLDIAGVVISRDMLDVAVEQTGHCSVPLLEHAHLRAAQRERAIALRGTLMRALEVLGQESLPAENVALLTRDVVSAVADALVAENNHEGMRIPQARRWQIVQRACAFANEVPQDLITIEAICKHLGISRRALQYCFQDTLDVAPAAYLRAVRLNGARRSIKTCGSVTDAATQWGFWHFGRFAQDYKAMFGELPSETCRQYHRAERMR